MQDATFIIRFRSHGLAVNVIFRSEIIPFPAIGGHRASNWKPYCILKPWPSGPDQSALLFGAANQSLCSPL